MSQQNEKPAKFRCLVCDGTEWQAVDQYRLKPEGMAMCTHCGFISYPEKWQSEEDLIQYYRRDYRSKPNFSNYCTGQRKLHFHNAFLKDVWKEWREAKKTKPVIGEIGAAHGMFLNYVREQFPEAELHGTELTISYRRCAYHEFGLNLQERFDTTRKYDFIASYKVAEHQVDVDKRLREYVECLKPGGLFYIGVPVWFGRLNNFGTAGFDIEYYYSPNHINVWTRNLFHQVLKKVGLKVIKFNDTMYDDAYLCVRDDSVMNEPRQYDDPAKRIDDLKRTFEGGKAFMEGRFDDAIKHWADFPDAHISRYEMNRARLNKGGWSQIEAEALRPALEQCPNCAEIHGFVGEVNMRYGRYEDAIKWFESMLRMRPGSSPAMRGITHSLRQLAEAAKQAEDKAAFAQYYTEARELSKYMALVSEGDKQECMNWIYSDNSKIPTPFEK